MISAFWNVFHVHLWCFRVLRSTSIKSMCPKIWGSKSKPGCRNIEIFDVSCSFPSSELPITNCLCHHFLWDNLPPNMAGFENWGSKTPVPWTTYCSLMPQKWRFMRFGQFDPSSLYVWKWGIPITKPVGKRNMLFLTIGWELVGPQDQD